ncbi:MAG TPA: hypothetical protein VGL81_11745 [Polyangiaceae bacterium]|jgi:hypothetical protein
MLPFVSRGLAALTLLSLTALTSTAHADPLAAEAPDPPAPKKPIFVDVAAGAGWVSSSNASFGGGPTMGATLLFRYSMIEAGATADVATQILSPTSRVDVGGLVGIGSQEWSFIGGDLLLEGGVRRYDDVGGCSFLCNYPGVSGSVPYVGLRAGVTLHPIHTPSTVFVGGLWFFVSRDLASESQTFALAGQGLLGPESGTQGAVIGGATELGVNLRLGWDTRF